MTSAIETTAPNMMTLYFAVASIVIAAGLYGLWAHRHLVRKLVAANILGSGIFLVLIAVARRSDPPDPIPHALVLTGIVVSVSVTAFSLVLIRKIHGRSGRASLPEDSGAGDG